MNLEERIKDLKELIGYYTKLNYYNLPVAERVMIQTKLSNYKQELKVLQGLNGN